MIKHKVLKEGEIFSSTKQGYHFYDNFTNSQDAESYAKFAEKAMKTDMLIIGNKNGTNYSVWAKI